LHLKGHLFGHISAYAILGAGKYHDFVFSHSKNTFFKSKSLFWDFIADFEKTWTKVVTESSIHSNHPGNKHHNKIQK
jgi:hypothetical protein